MVARRAKSRRAGAPTERVPSPEHRAPSRVRAAFLIGSFIAAGVVIGGAYPFIQESRHRARLPSLPAFSHEPAALRASIANADRAARASPTSSDLVGALGIAYHANMFYEQADPAYELAAELSGDWRWSYFRALVHEARGDPAVATALQDVVARAPQFSPAWWRLGEAEFKAGHRDAAVKAFERAQTLPEPPLEPWPGAPPRKSAAPIAAYAALGLARAALASGDAERARQVLEDVTTASPAFGPGMRLLATAYTSLGRAGDA